MKRWIICFLCVFVLLILSGCAEKYEPLRICVDVNYERGGGEPVEAIVERFMEHVVDLGGPKDYVVEVIPNFGSERESALTRIRTEIMSGEGPDIFISECSSRTCTNDYESLFSIPEKAMINGLFLPIDKYIADAQFTQWDKLTPQVMASGRDAYGQQIIPLSYTFPITVFRESDVSIKPGEDTVWQSMIGGNNIELMAAGTWFHPTCEDFSRFADDYIDYTFGTVADYENEILTFSEDELASRIEEILLLRNMYVNSIQEQVPAHYQVSMHIDFDNKSNAGAYIDAGRYVSPFQDINANEKKTFIPIYSDNGGTSAEITHFAAINSNTKRAKDAFFVLDVLLSLEVQQYSDLYQFILCGLHSIPMHSELFTEELQTHYVTKWYFTDENYEEFCRVREQISNVRFDNALTYELDILYSACEEAYYAEDMETFKQKVNDSYRRMEIMLRE